MNFKEKDPLVSMEQWFPGVVIEDVKEVDLRVRETEYAVDYEDLKDAHIVPRNTSIKYPSIPKVRGAVVKWKTHIQETGEELKFYMEDHSRFCTGLVTLLPSDWVLTYKSGRREVLTDKEKQERFE